MYRRKPDPNVVLPPNAGFGRRLEYLMIRNGFSSVDLAILTGVNEATIRNYCRSRREPAGMSKLMAIADHFGVTMDWLCGRSDNGGPV